MTPVKVTVTASGDLPVESSFFTSGDVDKIVYCPRAEAARIASALGGNATVVALRNEVTMRDVAEDLAERGVRRLMVEGGGRLHTQFLREDIAARARCARAERRGCGWAPGGGSGGGDGGCWLGRRSESWLGSRGPGVGRTAGGTGRVQTFRGQQGRAEARTA